MSHTVNVALGARSYAVHIGAGLLDDLGALAAPHVPRKTTAIVTDETVAALYLPQVLASLARAGINATTHILPPGESTKSFAQLAPLMEALLATGLERKDAIIALGGGVIGDLTGFAAALLRRGCPFIQVPTTLLAQVDSSVGGKTAINAAAGKNLIGVFHQPALVLADTAVLASLPPRQLRAGYAEVVKTALINDAGFFDWLEAHGLHVLNGDLAAAGDAVRRCVAAKAAIVAADEHETTGVRALLNLGHTFGHALEAQTGYSDALLHGEAVGIGCVLAFDLSVRLGLCPAEDAQRVRAHFAEAGMAVSPAEVGISCGAAPLLAHMRQDKKMEAGRLPFLLARGIGQTFLAKDVDLDAVAALLNDTAS
jgi:3-dehydroquinate synthase